jgi:hypothetical protein
MEISRLTIKNFRGVKRAELDFKGHARATSSRNFIKMRARRCGFVAAQAACAAIAFSTAARTSAFEARGTREITSPVMGSKPSQKRTDVPLACLPPMKWVSSFIGVPPVLPSRNRPAVSRLTVQRLTGRRHLLQPEMKALHLISSPRASPPDACRERRRSLPQRPRKTCCRPSPRSRCRRLLRGSRRSDGRRSSCRGR